MKVHGGSNKNVKAVFIEEMKDLMQMLSDTGSKEVNEYLTINKEIKFESKNILDSYRKDLGPLRYSQGYKDDTNSTKDDPTTSFMNKLDPALRVQRCVTGIPTLFKTIFSALHSESFEKDLQIFRNRDDKIRAFQFQNDERYLDLDNTLLSSAAAIGKLLSYWKIQYTNGINVPEDLKYNRTLALSKLRDHETERKRLQNLLRKKEIEAASILELMCGMRGGRSELTPTQIELGILLRLGGETVRAHNIIASSGVAATRSTTNSIVNSLVSAHVQYTKEYLSSMAEDISLVPLVILDNYNVLRWLKRIKASSSFTKNLASISILVKFLPKDSEGGDTSKHAYTPLDINKFMESLDGWSVPADCQPIQDSSHMHCSLFNFTPSPSLLAKSSSEKDIDLIILGEFLEGICRLSEKEVIVVVDPEIILLFGKMQFLQPGRLKNLVLYPPIFHIRKHLMENLFGDNVYSILLFLPLLIEGFGQQVPTFISFSISTVYALHIPYTISPNIRDVYLYNIFD